VRLIGPEAGLDWLLPERLKNLEMALNALKEKSRIYEAVCRLASVSPRQVYRSRRRRIELLSAQNLFFTSILR